MAIERDVAQLLSAGLLIGRHADISKRAAILSTSDGFAVPARYARRLGRFRYGPGVCKVDFALSGPVPWASAPAKAPGTVHVADSVADMVEATGQGDDGDGYALSPRSTRGATRA
mgnify:CR=1 FL=1